MPSRLPGHQRLANALKLVRNAGEDPILWLAQHVGNLRDERDHMRAEIANLKRRVSRLEKRTKKEAHA